MKATDLRIGNWVLIPTSMDGIIIPSFPKKVKGIGIFGGIDFTEPEYPENHIVPAVHCAGIPLTEEWLLKFGFNERETLGTKYYSLGMEADYGAEIIAYKKEYLMLREIHFDWRIYLTDCDGGKIGSDKEYIHQLQNLYFALNNKELKIKDNEKV